MRSRVPWLALLGFAGLGCNAFGGAAAELSGAGGAANTTSTTASAASGAGAGPGASGSGGGATGGSTSTGSVGVEDCTNGVDDNGDGLVDCEDPQCGAFACVPAAPAGWSLPGAFYYDIPQTVPACPMADPTRVVSGNAGLTFQNDSCQMCTCGQRTGQSCTNITVASYTTASNCTGQASNHVTTPNHCVSGFFNNPSVEARTNYVAGSCLPDGGSITDAPAATWTKVGKLCAPEATGKCASPDSVCAPKVGGEFGPSACISHDGDVGCPPGYPEKTTLYGDLIDTRGCSGCSCNPPANDCTAAISYYQGGNGDCGYSSPPGTITFATTGVCEQISNIESVYVGALSWPSQNTQCSASGGAPTGTVTPTSPTTVCCR
jgi:hypothetical protein